jgi:ABC-type uncharacterized transport system permease subunit
MEKKKRTVYTRKFYLFLLVGFFFSLITSTLFTGTESTSSRTSITELHVSVDVLIFSSDSTGFRASSNLFNGEESTAELNSRSNFGSLWIAS